MGKNSMFRLFLVNDDKAKGAILGVLTDFMRTTLKR